MRRDNEDGSASLPFHEVSYRSRHRPFAYLSAGGGSSSGGEAVPDFWNDSNLMLRLKMLPEPLAYFLCRAVTVLVPFSE